MQNLTERHRKELAGLRRARVRKEAGLYLIEGRRLLASALNAGADVREVIVVEAELETAEKLLIGHDIPITKARPADLERITDVQTHQGILAVGVVPSDGPTRLGRHQKVLVLDSVQDPGNVGTLIRSAAWFGFDAVIAGPGTADFYSAKVVRASMGGLWDVELHTSADLAELVLDLQREGFEAWCADMKGTDSNRWIAPRKLVLIMGSEAHGVHRGLVGVCDGSVFISAKGALKGTESLNVTAAAAILLSKAAEGSSKDD